LVSLTVVTASLIALAAPAAAGVCPNEESRAGASAALPDCRAFERVSAAENEGGDVYAPAVGLNGHAIPTALPFQAAASGSAVAYAGDPSATGNGSDGSGLGNSYLARRTAPGVWNAEDIQPTGLIAPLYEGFSTELEAAFLTSTEPLAATAPTGGFNVLYARDDLDATMHPLFEATPQHRLPGSGGTAVEVFGTADYEGSTPEVSLPVLFAGGSADLHHLLFEANDSLTGGAPDPGAGGNQLYDQNDGSLKLANILPNGEPALNASFGAPHPSPATVPSGGSSDPPNFSHVISDDGSRIFWSALDAQGSPLALYVREHGSTTVQIDASTAGGSGGGGWFWTASADGSRVVFSDGAAAGLTADTVPGSGQNLYEYDVASGLLTDLTPASTAGVVGVLGAGADAGYVYFVASGALASGATSQSCDNSAGSKCNLYLSHAGTLRFIAAVAQADDAFKVAGNNGEKFGDWQPSLASRTAEATPAGTHLIFMSGASLTGYPNLGYSEVYRYDAGPNELTCVSCDPTGEPPKVADSSALGAWVRPGFEVTYSPRWASANGRRVFFTSMEPLSPREENGAADVYEWEQNGEGSCAKPEGCRYLLSGGVSHDSSAYIDASESGEDVFLVSRAQLVSTDANENTDLFDVRVGGVNGSSLATCVLASECQQLPPALPAFQDPATVGASSEVPSSPAATTSAKTPAKVKRCRRGYTRHKGRCVKSRAKSRSHKARRGRR
jgi:hypothetical protein